MGYGYTPVKITHIPTGVSATCDESKSQFRNRNKAMSMLRGKLWSLQNEKLLYDFKYTTKESDEDAKE